LLTPLFSFTFILKIFISLQLDAMTKISEVAMPHFSSFSFEFLLLTPSLPPHSKLGIYTFAALQAAWEQGLQSPNLARGANSSRATQYARMLKQVTRNRLMIFEKDTTVSYGTHGQKNVCILISDVSFLDQNALTLSPPHSQTLDICSPGITTAQKQRWLFSSVSPSAFFF
jgi:hypothetical protein